MTSTTPTTDKFGFPAVPCSRCAGQGELSHFGHVDAGRCFQCLGERVVVVDPKAKAAKAAYLAARVVEATVADLEVGQTFTFGGSNCVTEWKKFLGSQPDRNGLSISTSKGKTGVSNGTFPVRIYVPTDVADFLKGL